MKTNHIKTVSVDEIEMMKLGSERFKKSQIQGKFAITKLGSGVIFNESKRIAPIIEGYVNREDVKRRSSWARKLRTTDYESVVASVLRILFIETTIGNKRKYNVRSSIVRTVSKIYYGHIDGDDSLKCGLGLVSTILRLCDIVEYNVVTKGKRRKYEFQFNHNFTVDEIENIVSESNRQFYPLPITEKPVDWALKREKYGSYHFVGGYHDFQFDIIRGDKAGQNRMSKDVLRALNAIQAVPFRINKDVLSVAKQELSKPPNKKDYVSSEKYSKNYEKYQNERLRYIERALKGGDKHKKKISRMVFIEAQDKWYEAKTVYKENKRRFLSDNSKWLVSKMAIEIAEQYKNEPKIYFPHNFDYRGRVYPIPIILNPQGNDLSKSLIEMAEPEEMTDEGVYQLTAYLASLFGDGREKKTLHERFLLGNDLVYEDWHKADEPYMTYQVQLVLRRFLENDDRMCHSTIALDGSINGFQHMSAITLDKEGAEMVNVCGKTRKDLYISVSDRTSEHIKDSVFMSKYADKRKLLNKSGEKMDEFLKNALKFVKFVGRKCVKRIVMTIPYGLSRHSAKDYVEEYLVEQEAPRELYRRSYWLSSLSYDTVHELMGGAKSFMDWIQNTGVEIATRKGEGRWTKIPRWTTPDGFKVIAPKYAVKKQLIKIDSLGRNNKVFTSKMRINKKTNKISQSGVKSSISPNFIHSLDGTHLRMTVNAMADEGIDKFVFIHDSFGTTPNNTSLLGIVLREQFAKMYDPNNGFRERVAEEMKASPIPVKGTLDIYDVLEQPHFFE